MRAHLKGNCGLSGHRKELLHSRVMYLEKEKSKGLTPDSDWLWRERL